MWTLLLLAATVRSFAHMLLGISDRNGDMTVLSVSCWPPVLLDGCALNLLNDVMLDPLKVLSQFSAKIC